MRFSDEILMAYADHDLDEKTRLAVESAMASDPEIARRIAQHRALRKRLHSAFEPVLDEPVPPHLIDLARHMMASGLLADALSRQLASQQRASEPVQIGVSFRSKSGDYCRTFSTHAPSMAGLACHALDGWRLQVLSGTEEPKVATGGYRQAASSMPAAIVSAMSGEISGEPLDARAEAAARSRDWQP
jgi:anti-sigma factor RsiW